MSRAGREPAEDVKRRIVDACRAARLDVRTARMYLRKELGTRLIMVAASPHDWPFEHEMISILTMVRTDGDWSGAVDVRSSTADDESLIHVWDTIVLRGRSQVPIEDLPRQLRKTVEEREQVVAAVRLGIDGPYVFDDVRWETPSCLL